VTGAADVVICGAGVAGLAAAVALGRHGLDVVLLDKKRVQPRIAKGEVLKPGSLAILHDWDVLPAFEARKPTRLNRLVARDSRGGELVTMDFETLGDRWSWMLAHDYTTILECLGESLGASVSWRRGVLAEDLVRDPGGRIAGVRTPDGEIRGRVVLAADGMSSRLRKAAGLSVNPVAYPHRLLSFELTGAQVPADEVSAHVTRRGLVMIYPLPEDRARVYVQVTTDELRTTDAVRLAGWCDELVAAVPALRPYATALTASLGTRQLLPVHHYQATSVVAPGLVLLGEAAHSVHPLAAQGMNTSIGDAHALAPHLAGADLGDDRSVDAALRAYEEERLPWVHGIQTMSHNAARMMTSTSLLGRMLGRRLLSGTGRNPRLRYQITYNMSGLGLRPLTTLDRLAQLGLLPARRQASP
jgi:2-polyprenyl-6-methoxyphenol hydroxylase-like FAD-dependent oxidoreductase